MGRPCASCGNVYDASLAFCPNDGSKLSDVLVEAERLLVSLVDTSTVKSAAGIIENTIASAGSPSVSAPPDASLRHTNITPESLIGTRVDNRYLLKSIIGTGGMSAVYKATDIYLKKDIALKMLLPHTMHFPLSLQRFQQEAQAASGLAHANVVTVYSFGVAEDTGRPYLAMDYLEGDSLSTFIGETRTIPVDRAIHIFIQVADALGHAHEKGVIHRDLKPSNVILVHNGNDPDFVKIVDFGIAKLLNQEGSDAVRLTQTGEIFGSPMYMSPEQCRGDKLDARADIYSLGCLMYEALVGDPPHGGSNSLEILYKHINVVPLPMSEAPFPVPHRLEKIIFKTLAKEPAERYQTMEALRHELIGFANERKFGVLARLKDRIELAWLKRRPKTIHEKAVATVCGALLVVVLLLSSWVFYLYWAALNSPANKKQLAWRESVPIYVPEGQMRMGTAYGDLVSKFDEDPLTRVRSKFTYANRFMHAGRWHEAIDALLTAYNESSSANGPYAIETFRVQNALAECYYRVGDYAKAKALFLSLFKLSHTLPIPNLMMSHAYMMLGDIMLQDNNLVEAEKDYKHAISMAAHGDAFSSVHTEYSLSFPEQPPSDDFVVGVGKLADIERLRHDQDEAQEYYTHVITYCDVIANDSNADASEKGRVVVDAFVNDAIARDRLAAVQMATGDRKNALKNYERAITLMKEALGKNHPYTALVTRDYANALWQSGSTLDSLIEHYQALSILAHSD